jgi:hypothetical protein
MANRLLTHGEVDALFRVHGLEPPRPAVPDDVWAACDHCWHRLHTTQMCCWCGQPRILQHGPYLPEGGLDAPARGR